ncbi:CLUMA_CG002843, isoform A [Clunio marinus]|uniref:CLUMA_CG002843, isoform A n=1 Tax=Clunio marinus TaxID=568069 RepID=A0A1J1HQY9_9DIPT|nr:CLUMA_CG002843, isoform A [Clunio marinus]
MKNNTGQLTVKDFQLVLVEVTLTLFFSFLAKCKLEELLGKLFKRVKRRKLIWQCGALGGVDTLSIIKMILNFLQLSITHQLSA